MLEDITCNMFLQSDFHIYYKPTMQDKVRRDSK